MKTSFLKMGWILLVIVVVGYLAFCLVVYFNQDRMIFFPEKLSSEQGEALRKLFPGSEIRLKTPDQKILHGWLLRSTGTSPAPLVLYYGGNAEEVSGNLFEPDRPKDVNFLYMNYRGYGLSEGAPSQKVFFQDALQVFDHILQFPEVDSNQVYLMGRSLGAAVAVHVASQRTVKGLILITPWDSLARLGQRHYPYLPVSLFLKHPFDSLSLAPQLKIPLLEIIAENDSIIPPPHSWNLVKNYAGSPTTVVIKGAEHNDLQDFPEYWETIEKFLRLTPAPEQPE